MGVFEISRGRMKVGLSDLIASVRRWVIPSPIWTPIGDLGIGGRVKDRRSDSGDREVGFLTTDFRPICQGPTPPHGPPFAGVVSAVQRVLVDPPGVASGGPSKGAIMMLVARAIT